MSPVTLAALSLYRDALIRALAVSPVRGRRLWARAEAARDLAHAVGAAPETVATVTLAVLREGIAP